MEKSQITFKMLLEIMLFCRGTPHSLPGLSSPARDQTCAPYSGSAESQSLDLEEIHSQGLLTRASPAVSSIPPFKKVLIKNAAGCGTNVEMFKRERSQFGCGYH